MNDTSSKITSIEVEIKEADLVHVRVGDRLLSLRLTPHGDYSSVVEVAGDSVVVDPTTKRCGEWIEIQAEDPGYGALQFSEPTDPDRCRTLEPLVALAIATWKASEEFKVAQIAVLHSAIAAEKEARDESLAKHDARLKALHDRLDKISKDMA